MKTQLSIATSVLLLSACGQMANQMQTVKFNGQTLEAKTTDRTTAMSCLNNRVDYVLNTEVVDFEMNGGGGVHAGFSPTGGILSNIGLGVNYSQGELQTMMHLSDPLKPGVPIVDSPGAATNSNISFSLDLIVGLVSVGPSFWYSTSVADLSNNALQDNLTNLNQKLTSLVLTDWWTTVSKVNGSLGVIIPVGSNAGILPGDKFKIMDASYEWAGNGEPCINELMMPVINSNTPKAVLQAKTVGINYTYLVFEKVNAAINLYDYVTIGSLVQPPQVQCANFLGIGCPDTPARRTTLARSVRIGKVSSRPLNFTGQNNEVKTVDISPFVLDQLETLLPQQEYGGFYLHQ